MKDLKSILVAVLSALFVGFGSSYLTATATLATFEARQMDHRKRIDQLEADRRSDGSKVEEVTTELRVLNERLKRFDDNADSLRRLERKIDDVLIRRNAHNDP